MFKSLDPTKTRELSLSLYNRSLTLTSYSNKAVADGSLLHYIENLVTSRLARYALGSECIRDYDSQHSGHARHSSLVQISETGRKEIHRMFDIIIEKVSFC